MDLVDAYRDVIESPTPEAFIRLRKAVGWPVPTRTAAAEALTKDLYSVSIQRAGECVACGRVVGDGVLVFYVQDVMVLPDHQNCGLGKKLLKAVEDRFPEAERYELFTGQRSKKNIHIYTSCGYRPFKTQVVSDKLTLVYLEKVRPNMGLQRRSP